MLSLHSSLKRSLIHHKLGSGIALAVATLLLSSCATLQHNQAKPKHVAKKQVAVAVKKTPPVVRGNKLSLSERLAYPVKLAPAPIAAAAPVYSFQARNMEIRDALSLFANAYKLNIVADQDVSGTVSVAFHDLPFDQSMQAILSSLGYYWERSGDLIKVRLVDERVFTVNYLRMTRSDSTNHQTTVTANSSASSSGSSGTAGAQGSSFNIGHKDEILFWKELEEQLSQMISAKDYARVSVNKMSGTIQVVDNHANVERIANFINKLNDAIKRQISIEVQIVEVTLNEDFNLGIDWTALDQSLTGFVFDVTTGNIVNTALAGVAATTNPLDATIGYNANNGNKFSSIINALKEQGDVNIVSKPHIRTLNNQPALIKVGTDRTYFSTQTVTTATTGGFINNVTDESQVITEGIVLSITPQISEENWVMMDVSPVLTRVTNETISRSGNSNAPEIDVRQSTSIVRVQSGQTIILGGLIQDIEAETNRKVPGLGDVPAFGKLFSGKRKVKEKKELVIFLTPKIIGLNEVVQEARQ